jgi:hypothetical protein
MPFQKGWGERTDQSESAAGPPYAPSHIPLPWHSGTEVVTSGWFYILKEIKKNCSEMKGRPAMWKMR